MNKMKHFLSCDWGTSSFRLRLVEVDSLKVLAEVRGDEGIASTYQAWLEVKDSVDRQEFYVRIIKEKIEELSSHDELKSRGISLERIQVVLSGMASSTIGLIDLPYKALPFALDGSNLNVNVLSEDNSDNSIVIISGAASVDDVMRGEETKVLGCAQYPPLAAQKLQLIMPGTHPKHILIEDQQVRSFKTYMTGEFFDLLSERSVLAGSVKTGGDWDEMICRQHFSDGVTAGAEVNILHASFMVRTRQVLHQVPAEYNYYYLSGLLIGAELKNLDKSLPSYLVSAGVHTKLYLDAFAVLGFKIEQVIDADEALIRGQAMVIGKILESS